MRCRELLDDAFVRIPAEVRHAVVGLDRDALAWQPEPGANPIGWLVWHLTRVQDDHVADLAGREQTWFEGGWAARFGLPEATTDIGYGHSLEQVRSVRPEGVEVLLEYLDEVTSRTRAFLTTIDIDDLDRVIDTSWDPPVTMGVRLISVISDSLQHAGQAAYLRGILDRTVHAQP